MVVIFNRHAPWDTKIANLNIISYAEMNHNHGFMYNQIFHDEDLKLSGCIPPKTGSTSWNHFWWGTSKYDGAGPGKYDSFQSQGNRYKNLGAWQEKLRSKKPELLFLTTRHPIERLISGWNNILCKDKDGLYDLNKG